jgi:hypothetical protein
LKERENGKKAEGRKDFYGKMKKERNKIQERP